MDPPSDEAREKNLDFPFTPTSSAAKNIVAGTKVKKLTESTVEGRSYASLASGSTCISSSCSTASTNIPCSSANKESGLASHYFQTLTSKDPVEIPFSSSPELLSHSLPKDDALAVASGLLSSTMKKASGAYVSPPSSSRRRNHTDSVIGGLSQECDWVHTSSASLSGHPNVLFLPQSSHTFNPTAPLPASANSLSKSWPSPHTNSSVSSFSPSLSSALKSGLWHGLPGKFAYEARVSRFSPDSYASEDVSNYHGQWDAGKSPKLRLQGSPTPERLQTYPSNVVFSKSSAIQDIPLISSKDKPMLGASKGVMLSSTEKTLFYASKDILPASSREFPPEISQQSVLCPSKEALFSGSGGASIHYSSQVSSDYLASYLPATNPGKSISFPGNSQIAESNTHLTFALDDNLQKSSSAKLVETSKSKSISCDNYSVCVSSPEVTSSSRSAIPSVIVCRDATQLSWGKNTDSSGYVETLQSQPVLTPEKHLHSEDISRSDKPKNPPFHEDNEGVLVRGGQSLSAMKGPSESREEEDASADILVHNRQDYARAEGGLLIGKEEGAKNSLIVGNTDELKNLHFPSGKKRELETFLHEKGGEIFPFMTVKDLQKKVSNGFLLSRTSTREEAEEILVKRENSQLCSPDTPASFLETKRTAADSNPPSPPSLTIKEKPPTEKFDSFSAHDKVSRSPSPDLIALPIQRNAKIPHFLGGGFSGAPVRTVQRHVEPLVDTEEVWYCNNPEEGGNLWSSIGSNNPVKKRPSDRRSFFEFLNTLNEESIASSPDTSPSQNLLLQTNNTPTRNLYTEIVPNKEPVVILDIGSLNVRVGATVCGFESGFPSVRAPSLVFQPWSYSDPANLCECPFENGLVKNWDSLEDMMLETLTKRFPVENADTSILMCQSKLLPPKEFVRYGEFFFEVMQNNALCFKDPEFLALLSISRGLRALGNLTGVLVDLGASMTKVTPFISGIPLIDASCHLPIGGNNIDYLILKELQKLGEGLQQSEISLRAARIGKEKLSQAFSSSDDYMLEVAVAARRRSSYSVSPIRYGMKSSEKMVNYLSTSFLDGPEIFFNQRMLQASRKAAETPERRFDTRNLPNVIVDIIQQCPLDCRGEMYKNIIIIGGCSLIPGLVIRTGKELESLLEHRIRRSKRGFNVRVRTMKTTCLQENAIWGGGLLYALRAAYDTDKISKALYEEHGSKILAECSQAGRIKSQSWLR